LYLSHENGKRPCVREVVLEREIFVKQLSFDIRNESVQIQFAQSWFPGLVIMLARYVLSSCVRPSVRPFVTSRYCIDTTKRIELVFGMEASFHLSDTFGTSSRTPDLENFATASRSRCQQNSSSSSTDELVDGTYTTIDESWLLVNCNPLTPLWICCTLVSTIDKILRVARSVCGSRASCFCGRIELTVTSVCHQARTILAYR